MAAPRTAPPPTPPVASPAPAAPSAASAPDSSGAATSPPSANDWQTVLATVDPDDLIKDPRISGRLGNAIQRQAKKEADSMSARIEAQVREKIELERIERLKDEDPFEGVRAERAWRDQQTARQQDTSASAQVLAEVNRTISEIATQYLPEEALAALRGKTYEGNVNQALSAFMGDVFEQMGNHLTPTQRAKVETELREAIRTDLLADVNGDRAQRPDNGTARPLAGALDNDEWQRNGHDKAWRTANRERINNALGSGRIQPFPGRR